jgi:RimJ/RimL family protein N-acetyltransferase
VTERRNEPFRESGHRGGSGSLTTPTRLTRLKRRFAREGLGPTLGWVFLRAIRLVYEREDLIFVDLNLEAWAPRYLRRAGGVEITEMRYEDFHRWRDYLDPDQRRWVEDELAQGSRFFITLRNGKLGGIVATNRKYYHPPWDVSCEVEPDALIFYRVLVESEFRRGALGGMMVERVFEKVRNEGIRRIVGCIHKDNDSSRIFAENIGLQQFEKLRRHRLLSVFRLAPRIVEGRKQQISRRGADKGSLARSRRAV